MASSAARPGLSSFRDAFLDAPIGVVVSDMDYRFLEANPSFLRLLGYTREELRGASELTEFTHPDDRAVCVALIQELCSQTIPGFTHEKRYIAKDGRAVWVQIHVSLLRDPETREPNAILGLILDITQKRKAELALRESEKMAVVGRLAASIAHEINNPLESITNLLYLARQCELTPEVADYLRVAETEIRRIAHITTLTLSFHRQLSTPKFTTARELFNSVLELYRSRLMNNGILPQVGEVTSTPFRALEGELRQILAHLISNAIDAMRTGGVLHLRARDARDPKSGVRGVRLVVADTGEGIPPGLRKEVFRAFFTTKQLDGTGLGLWLSKSIVENHHGHIALRSRRGSGTVFSIFLPLNPHPDLQPSPVFIS